MLTGGSGGDTFTFSTTEGVELDMITDFHSGEDVVQLDGVGPDFDVMAHITDTDAGAMLQTGDGQPIVFEGVPAADLHATDFHLT